MSDHPKDELGVWKTPWIRPIGAERLERIAAECERDGEREESAVRAWGEASSQDELEAMLRQLSKGMARAALDESDRARAAPRWESQTRKTVERWFGAIAPTEPQKKVWRAWSVGDQSSGARALVIEVDRAPREGREPLFDFWEAKRGPAPEQAYRAIAERLEEALARGEAMELSEQGRADQGAQESDSGKRKRL